MIKYICDCCNKESKGLRRLTSNYFGGQIQFDCNIDNLFPFKNETILDKSFCHACFMRIIEKAFEEFKQIKKDGIK